MARGARAHQLAGLHRRRSRGAGSVGRPRCPRPVPRCATRAARRQHAARPPVGGVRGRPARGGRPRPTTCRCCWCRRCRPPAGSRSTGCTCSTAMASGCRSTRRSTPATARSPSPAPTSRCGPTSAAMAPGRRRCDRVPAAAGRRGDVDAALVRPPRARPAGRRHPRRGNRGRPRGHRERPARRGAATVIVRCAPAFAATLTGSGAGALVDAPRATAACWSCADRSLRCSTQQLARLELRAARQRRGPRGVAALGGRGLGMRGGHARLRAGRPGAGPRWTSRWWRPNGSVIPRWWTPRASGGIGGRARAQVARPGAGGRRDRQRRDHLGGHRARRPGRAGRAGDRTDPDRRLAVAAAGGDGYVVVPGNVGGPSCSSSWWPRSGRAAWGLSRPVRRPAGGAPGRGGGGGLHVLRPRGSRRGARRRRRTRPGRDPPDRRQGVRRAPRRARSAGPRRRRRAADAEACVQLDHCDDLGVIAAALGPGGGRGHGRRIGAAVCRQRRVRARRGGAGPRAWGGGGVRARRHHRR